MDHGHRFSRRGFVGGVAGDVSQLIAEGLIIEQPKELVVCAIDAALDLRDVSPKLQGIGHRPRYTVLNCLLN